MLHRRLAPEILDTLPTTDPRAQRSRNDLRRLHRAMGTLSIACSALDHAAASAGASKPKSLLELGAGDGTMMSRLARKRAKRWPGIQASMLDRVNLVQPETLEAIRQQGWKPGVIASDVFDWLAIREEKRWDLIWANLFIHHFEREELAGLLFDVAQRTRAFVCCEPRRSLLPLVGSRLLGALGAGSVTRHDAVVSVRAGFRGKELSHLWPDRKAWLLHEYPAGLFSHCFVAIRKKR